MIDYRKLLIAQMVACNDFDGGWPGIDDEWVRITPEEMSAYIAASDEAAKLLQERGPLKEGEFKDLVGNVSPLDTPLMRSLK